LYTNNPKFAAARRPPTPPRWVHLYDPNPFLPPSWRHILYQDFPFKMLLGKASLLRSFEYYHLFIIFGLIILLWKIWVDSVALPRVPVPSYSQELDGSAGNATLGVR
jgi:hypothetical protein